jgi:hypothetical protein
LRQKTQKSVNLKSNNWFCVETLLQRKALLIIRQGTSRRQRVSLFLCDVFCLCPLPVSNLPAFIFPHRVLSCHMMRTMQVLISSQIGLGLRLGLGVD